MEIERYSHVMHISSTVTGSLLPDLGVWDVLRAALPAGTVSGAPKVHIACPSVVNEMIAAGAVRTQLAAHGGKGGASPHSEIHCSMQAHWKSGPYFLAGLWSAPVIESDTDRI